MLWIYSRGTHVRIAIELGPGSFILVLDLPLFSSLYALLPCFCHSHEGSVHCFPCHLPFMWRRVISCIWKHLPNDHGSGGSKGHQSGCNTCGEVASEILNWNGLFFFDGSLITSIVYIQTWIAFINTHFVLELYLALRICYFN